MTERFTKEIEGWKKLGLMTQKLSFQVTFPPKTMIVFQFETFDLDMILEKFFSGLQQINKASFNVSILIPGPFFWLVKGNGKFLSIFNHSTQQHTSHPKILSFFYPERTKYLAKAKENKKRKQKGSESLLVWTNVDQDMMQTIGEFLENREKAFVVRCCKKWKSFRHRLERTTKWREISENDKNVVIPNWIKKNFSLEGNIWEFEFKDDDWWPILKDSEKLGILCEMRLTTELCSLMKNTWWPKVNKLTLDVYRRKLTFPWDLPEFLETLTIENLHHFKSFISTFSHAIPPTLIRLDLEIGSLNKQNLNRISSSFPNLRELTLRSWLDEPKPNFEINDFLECIKSLRTLKKLSLLFCICEKCILGTDNKDKKLEQEHDIILEFFHFRLCNRSGNQWVAICNSLKVFELQICCKNARPIKWVHKISTLNRFELHSATVLQKDLILKQGEEEEPKNVSLHWMAFRHCKFNDTERDTEEKEGKVGIPRSKNYLFHNCSLNSDSPKCIQVILSEIKNLSLVETIEFRSGSWLHFSERYSILIYLHELKLINKLI
jgi:hypothetical protein